MKNSRAKHVSKIKSKRRSSMPELVHRGIPDRRFVGFPQMKGRIVENIEFFTMSGFHSLTVTFQDKTTLNLILAPSLLIDSHFSDVRTGNERVVKRWPTIRTVTSRDE